MSAIPFDPDLDDYARLAFESETFASLAGKDFDDCLFKACDFKVAVLSGATFSRCRFENCDLSNAPLASSRWIDCQFKASKMMGLNWVQAKEQRGLSFEECNLSYNNFKAADLRKAAFKSCRIQDADFGDARLNLADFGGSSLQGTQFLHADLSGADLRGALDYAIDPLSCKVKGAKMSFPEALALVRALGVVISN